MQFLLFLFRLLCQRWIWKNHESVRRDLFAGGRSILFGLVMKLQTMPEINTQEPPAKKAVAYIFEWLDSAVFSMFVVILLFTFFFGIVGVQGESMQNTLFEGDKLIITHFNYTPEQGDIVIVSRNYNNSQEDAVNGTAQEPIVKRIVAVAGQRVEIKNGKVYIDNEELQEDYTTSPTEAFDFTAQVVPDGHVFVLGDNRQDSHDSRMSDIGMVDTRYIMGKVILRIYPFDQIGLF